MTHFRGNAWITFLLSLSIAIAGCTGRDRASRPSSASDAASAQAQAGDTSGTSGVTTADSASDAAAANPLKVLYFDFDRSEVRTEYRDALAQLAQLLASNSRLRLALEGHADERGSREYNIGLGERRAQSVRRVLLLSGTGEEQVSTVSYGEERPAVSGHDEEAWQLNRRVEIRVTVQQ